MKYVLFFSLFLSLIACNNQAEKPDADNTTQTSVDTSFQQSELPEAAVDKSQLYIWNVDTDKKSKTKNPSLRPEFYNVDTLIAGLNAKYPHIRLEKRMVSHDTLYTTIADPTYLTEQMGSTGAEQYVAQAVLNLTSVDGIHYVKMDFEPGSHAEPDTWSSEMFKDYQETNP